MISLSQFLCETQTINEAFLIPELNNVVKDLKKYKLSFNQLPHISKFVPYDKLTSAECKLVPLNEKTYKEIFSLRSNKNASVFFKFNDGYKAVYIPEKYKMMTFYKLSHDISKNYYYFGTTIQKNSASIKNNLRYEFLDTKPTFALIINPSDKQGIDTNIKKYNRTESRKDFIPTNDEEIKLFYQSNNIKGLKIEDFNTEKYFQYLIDKNVKRYEEIIAKNKIEKNSPAEKYKPAILRYVEQINDIAKNVVTADELQGKYTEVNQLLSLEQRMLVYFSELCECETEIKTSDGALARRYKSVIERAQIEIERTLNEIDEKIILIKK